MFKKPLMSRSGGYVDPAIQRIFVLSSAYDIEQAVMRGRIRENPTIPYTACVLASSLDVVSALTRKFTGANFTFDDSWIVEQIQAGDSIADVGDAIRKEKGLKSRQALEKAKEIARSFSSIGN